MPFAILESFISFSFDSATKSFTYIFTAMKKKTNFKLITSDCLKNEEIVNH